MDPRNTNPSTQSSGGLSGREESDHTDQGNSGDERENPSSGRRDERTARPRPEDSPHLPRYGDTEPDGPGHTETAETPDDQRI
jgi:hypothetical protein